MLNLIYQIPHNPLSIIKDEFKVKSPFFFCSVKWGIKFLIIGWIMLAGSLQIVYGGWVMVALCLLKGYSGRVSVYEL